jgi:DNA-binding IclR family transcriptional regulator
VIPLVGNLCTMSGVQSVERALAILREIGSQPGGLVDIAERTELPTSTAARLLATLDSGGAVRRDAVGVYRIGPEIVAMAGPTAGSDIVAFARQHMVALAEQIDEAVALSVPSGTTTTTIEQIDAPKPVRAEDWTGTVVPLHAGCVGLVTLAFWDVDALDAYLDAELAVLTQRTIVDPLEIRSRLDVLRRGEMLWTHGEYVDGISSVAAPILNELGQPVAALYSYGPSYRFPSRSESGLTSATEVFESVTRAAERISIDLGWVVTDRPGQFERFGAA